MWDYVENLFETGSLAPHGYCLLWRPELVWTHVISDALIGLAYYSIPVALAWFVTKRRDLAFGWVFWCFAAFILACGTTHFAGIWTLWRPDYGMEAAIKAMTATASVATAAVLWPLLPRALALPSPEQLRLANAELTERVAERDAALLALQQETAERERTQAMLREAQKLEAIGQLTGGVAHDFNNLMTIVIGNLDRVARYLPSDVEDAHRSLDDAIEGAERAADLTQQLLAFGRQQPLMPTDQDVNALVERTAQLFERGLAEKASVTLDCEPDLWSARIDATGTQNALLNLLVNARDALPEGGDILVRTRNVVISDHPEVAPGSYVCVEVIDRGEGMTAEVAERAFEPFFTTKPIGKGTGLGLAQVYGFAKQSNGHASLDSREGEGTSVTLLLPSTA